MRIRTFVVTSFLGLAGTGFAQQTDFGFTAFSGGNAGTPDPDLAVGPTHIVGVANFAVKVFDKQGNELQSVSLKDFFGSTTGTVFDPVALWDPHSGRYLIAAAEHEPLPFASPTDYLDVAVSAGTSPIGPSHRYRFNIIMDCDYVEYLNLGVNEEAVYASADCVNFGGANCWVLDKVELLQGLPLVPTKISLSGGSPAILGNTKNFDPGSPAQYLVSTITTSQMVTLYAVVDPLGAATVSTRILNVPTWAEPPDAAQRGGSGYLDTIDSRVRNGVVRNGHLYFCHTVDGGDGAAKVRWYEVDLHDWPVSAVFPTVVQSGTIDPGTDIDTWCGDIHADEAGDIAVVYNRNSASERVRIERAYRLAGDPLGWLRDAVALQFSTAGKPTPEWGEVSALEEDPAQPGTFWSHAEFYTADGWRTWIARADLGSPCPSNDMIAISGPDFGVVGSTVTFQYAGADPNARFAFLFSSGLGSSFLYGQCFNIGPNVTAAGTGWTTPWGAGSWTSPILPPPLSGHTVFVEMGVAGPSGTRDSNALAVPV